MVWTPSYPTGIYSLQHPTRYMWSAKSYAAHLTGIYAALESEAAAETNCAAHRWLSGPADLICPDHPQPQKRSTLTITHVYETENPDEHVRRVREWAESTWAVWLDYHVIAKDWVVEATRK